MQMRDDLGKEASDCMNDYGMIEYEFEVWCKASLVAGCRSADREEALKDAQHYVTQYSEDGPCEIYEVTRTKVDKLPFLAVGNGELTVPLGDKFMCPRCNVPHEVKYGEERLSDGTLVPSKLIAFYECNSSVYVCGLNGMELR